MRPTDELPDSGRRDVLKLTALGGLSALAGCVGGFNENAQSDFQSELQSLNVAESWRDRRVSDLDAWPADVRQQTPDNTGQPDRWLESTAVQEGPWSPPSNWEDTIASEVDQLRIINFGGLQGDPATAATYAAFERETGIEIVPEEMPAGQAHTRQNSFLSTESSSPSIFQVGTPVTLSSFIQAGYLEPVDGLMPQEEMWEPYPDYIRDAFSTDIGPDDGSHLYAGPGIRWNTIMHIRKDLLEEQGIDPERFSGEYTWDDLEMVMEEFKDTDKYGYAYWGGEWNFVIKHFKELVYQQGAQLVQDDGQVVMNHDQAVTALQKMVEWRENGLVPENVVTYSEGDLHDLLINDRLVMHSSKGAQINGAIESGLEPGEDYMVALQPKATTGPNPRQFGLGHLNNTSLNRFADPAQKLAGALYMDCRWSYESQWWEYTHEANDSYMNPVFDDAAEIDAAPFSDVRRKAANRVSNDFIPQALDLMQELGQSLQSAIAGQSSPEEALNSTQETVNTVLGQ